MSSVKRLRGVFWARVVNDSGETVDAAMLRGEDCAVGSDKVSASDVITRDAITPDVVTPDERRCLSRGSVGADFWCAEARGGGIARLEVVLIAADESCGSDPLGGVL